MNGIQVQSLLHRIAGATGGVSVLGQLDGGVPVGHAGARVAGLWTASSWLLVPSSVLVPSSTSPSLVASERSVRSDARSP